MKNNSIKHQLFKETDINDPFFTSLKADYPGFEEWFAKKRDQGVYVLYDDKNKLQGFLYLKKRVWSSRRREPDYRGKQCAKSRDI